MTDILPKILTYVFVVVVYAFIYTIIRMIFLDIHTMRRKKKVEDTVVGLKVINYKKNGEFDIESFYPLDKDNLIGRGKRCNIKIDDKALSASHARIYRADDTYFIEDVGSANGTLLNGEDISNEVVELIDKDKISMGTLVFEFSNPEE